MVGMVAGTEENQRQNRTANGGIGLALFDLRL